MRFGQRPDGVSGWMQGRRGQASRSSSMAASIVAVLLTLAFGYGSAGAAPKVGDPAPDFTLPYATADTVVFKGESLLDAVKHGPILLAFYPADWSAGCTKEVCTLRDSFADLAALKVTVWGISGDQVFSHRAWAEHHQLPFRLLSDLRHEVAPAYDSYNPESGFNRRTVYVVGRDGRILYADSDYSVKDDSDLAALKTALAKTQ